MMPQPIIALRPPFVRRRIRQRGLGQAASTSAAYQTLAPGQSVQLPFSFDSSTLASLLGYSPSAADIKGLISTLAPFSGGDYSVGPVNVSGGDTLTVGVIANKATPVTAGLLSTTISGLLNTAYQSPGLFSGLLADIESLTNPLVAPTVGQQIGGRTFVPRIAPGLGPTSPHAQFEQMGGVTFNPSAPVNVNQPGAPPAIGSLLASLFGGGSRSASSSGAAAWVWVLLLGAAAIFLVKQ